MLYINITGEYRYDNSSRSIWTEDFKRCSYIATETYRQQADVTAASYKALSQSQVYIVSLPVVRADRTV